MRAFNIVRWAALSLLILMLAIPAAWVYLGHRTILEVEGESMKPTFQVGEVVVIRPPKPADLVAGTVVTAESAEKTLYTHRIEFVDPDGNMQLKGDGNVSDDPGVVTPSQIKGVVIHHIQQPWAALLIQLQQWPLRICMLVVIIGLALMSLGASRRAPARVAAGRRKAKPVRGRRRAEPRRRSTHIIEPQSTVPQSTVLSPPLPSTVSLVPDLSVERMAELVAAFGPPLGSPLRYLPSVNADWNDELLTPRAATAVSEAADAARQHPYRQLDLSNGYTVKSVVGRDGQPMIQILINVAQVVESAQHSSFRAADEQCHRALPRNAHRDDPGRTMMRVMAVCTVAIALAALTPSTAMASPRSAREDAAPVTIGLRPVGQTHSFFDLTMSPGETRSLSVDLVNPSAEPVTAQTFAADAITLGNGGFGAKALGSAPTGATTWISYPASTVPLAQNGTTARSLRVTVPKNAVAGEYVSSLVVQDDKGTTEAQTPGLHQNIRTAIAVSIRVPGDLQPQLTVGTASYALNGTRSTIAVALSNDGNARIAPVAKIVVRGDGRKVAWRGVVTMDSFYASTATTLETTLLHPLSPGDYTVSLALTDAAAGLTPVSISLPLSVTGAPAASARAAEPLATLVQPRSSFGTTLIFGSLAVFVVLLILGALILRRDQTRLRAETTADSNTAETTTAETTTADSPTARNTRAGTSTGGRP